MATATQPERATVEEQVLDIIREILRELGSEQAARNAKLSSTLERELGLGSLERVELLVRCEKRFGRPLPDTLAQSAETPADWVRALLVGRTDGNERQRYRIEQPEREAPAAPDTARTWTEVLWRHAEVEPDRVQIHLLEGDSGHDITYGTLLDKSLRVAAGLKARGLEPNETVAIMLPTSSDFFYSFFGVMLAGGVAVPIYPPARPDKIEEYVRRQVKILHNAEVRFLITWDRARSVSNLMGLSLPSLRGVTSVAELERVGRDSGARPRPADVQASDIAFIQYTSGSTGDPKGVVLTQSNVLANVRGIGCAVKFRPDDVVVTWLPLYHDMGLIGSWLFSVYYGAPITVLSPLDFLARPERWLWALHDSGGSLCPAPNFAYELCARKIREEALAGLDLSRWRVAINAGEAVLPDTLARFAERFAPYGFRPEAYVPCYGLAESSVALTFPAIDRPPRIDTIERRAYSRDGQAVPAPADAADPRSAGGPPATSSSEVAGRCGGGILPAASSTNAGWKPAPQPQSGWNPASHSDLLRFVANGAPLPGHEVQLVDDQGHVVGERAQGRILFRGPSRTPGYYRNPKASSAVIDAEGWMDSGDLGYWASGELFVTGRAKDLIIRAGHNIVPQEIEAATAEVKGVRRGCVAAFGSRDPRTGTERVVVVAETRETHARERKRIKADVVHRVAAAGVPPDRIVLAPPGAIPKTSSGKIRRHETKRLYESGKLGGTHRPAWVQITSLALSNLGNWAYRRTMKAAIVLYQGYSAAVWSALSWAGGALASVLPGDRRRARVARAAVRGILGLTGQPVKLELAGPLPNPSPAILVANRAGSLDAVILAAALPRLVLLADTGDVSFMPPRISRLLRHLVVQPVENEAYPPGGRLRERIKQAIAQRESVLVLSENAAGAPPSLSRFRLDAFHAAEITGTALVPVGVRGTSHVLDPRHRGMHHRAVIKVGHAIMPGSCAEREIVELRERVRGEIAELCR
jgi:fatty-acyl-CoA synthase